MPFCTQCGNKLSAGARFCGKCGRDQLEGQSQCPKCGKKLEENEKFCSGCGTPVAQNVQPKTKPQKQTPHENKEEKFTKKGRKIISGGPKSPQNKQVNTPPPSSSIHSKKKKRGCRGCAITSVIFLAALIVLTMLLYNRVSDWWHDYKAEQGIELNTDGVDGIVDIEKRDVSHLPENRNEDDALDNSGISDFVAPEIKESKAMKAASQKVEVAFLNADIEQLKRLFSEQSKLNYSNLSADIQPLMKDYAEAFKKRKLVLNTENYALYEFKGKDGKRYTVEFVLDGNGEWKLVRF